MNNSLKKTGYFCIRMSPMEASLLDALSHRMGLTPSATVRQAIEAAALQQGIFIVDAELFVAQLNQTMPAMAEV